MVKIDQRLTELGIAILRCFPTLLVSKMSQIAPQNPDTALLVKAVERTMEWPFRIWGFGEGVALRGLLAAGRATDDENLFRFVENLLRTYVNRGVGKTNAEHIAPGSELLILYEKTGDNTFLEAAMELAKLNASFPKNALGARMHRPDMPGWRKQIWVDCLDGDGPFLVKLGNLLGDDTYIQQGLDELLGYAKSTQIDDGSDISGLFWHGYETDCGTNGQLWARGNGWALMGMVEALKLLPESHESRTELHDRLLNQCRALRRYQSRRGLWNTVITHPETYLESTLAVMAASALREAIQESYLDEAEFGEMESQAREGARGCINDDGELERVSDATPIGELKMYATRPFGVYPWGQGPLLLMLSQEII